MEYIDEGQARLEPFRFPKGYRGPDFSVWYVTSSGEFFPVSHRERPGVQLPFSGEFSFAGYRWLVPGVYSTAKALVVDLCREVPLQAIQDFIQKWNLTPENDDSDCFSKAQRMEMEAENPLEHALHCGYHCGSAVVWLIQPGVWQCVPHHFQFDSRLFVPGSGGLSGVFSL